MKTDNLFSVMEAIIEQRMEKDCYDTGYGYGFYRWVSTRDIANYAKVEIKDLRKIMDDQIKASNYLKNVVVRRGGRGSLVRYAFKDFRGCATYNDYHLPLPF